MAWFRLEDSWHSHPKVLAAGNAAAGLWVRCATYSAQHELDGKVPGIVARQYGTKVDIARLTAVGLWRPRGDDFVIVDFLDFNPSSADLKAKRDAAKERMRKARAFKGSSHEQDENFAAGSRNPDPTRPDTRTSEDDNLSVPRIVSSSDSIKAVAELLAEDVYASRGDVPEANRVKFINGTRRNITQERRREIVDALKAADGDVQAAYEALRVPLEQSAYVAPMGARPPHPHELAGCTRCEPTWGKYDTGRGYADCNEIVHGADAVVVPLHPKQEAHG